MDLPPDKAKLLKNYDNEKKWDIICDQVRTCLATFNANFNFLSFSQEMVQAKDPPSHYLTKLRTYLDPKASRSHRVSSFPSFLLLLLLSVPRDHHGSNYFVAHEQRKIYDAYVGHDINLCAYMSSRYCFDGPSIKI